MLYLYSEDKKRRGDDCKQKIKNKREYVIKRGL